MKAFRWIVIVLALFSASCGVKRPPIAPQREPDPTAQTKLNCSPYDEDCDKTDPNYQPRKR